MKASFPLVSVICLCYNHERFVAEAIKSVLSQTYPNIELIVVDDASTDGSAEVIRDAVKTNPSIRSVLLRENVGNCKAFNAGLQYASGDFLIDLAADDLLLPTRVAEGVKTFNEHGSSYGLHFSDAEYINENGGFLYYHSTRFPHHIVPQGDVYRYLIKWYFICPTSVMFKKEVIEQLGGYDETLMYEDFDFWIRSSRTFKYCYTDKVLVKKRILPNSLSSRQFQRRSRYQETTYRVCEKIRLLNKTKEEALALNKRLIYETAQAIKMMNFALAVKFIKLWLKNS